LPANVNIDIIVKNTNRYQAKLVYLQK